MTTHTTTEAPIFWSWVGETAVTDASDLGLRPGQWPDVIRVEKTNGERIDYVRGVARFDRERDLVAFGYAATDTSVRHRTLLVAND